MGHVEWVDFARVERLPARGEILHASETFEEPAGGGAVAAVQLARLAGEAHLLAALGDDERGRLAVGRLEELGVRVHATFRPEAQRRAFTLLDGGGERTITVFGERMAPRGADPLSWELLAEADAVYFTAGDEEALRAARAARVLTATPRAGEPLRRAGVKLDAVIGSGNDPGEALPEGGIEPRPALLVSTEGMRGGRWERPDGAAGRWPAEPLPGPAADSYGAGDSFAAGLTYALGRGDAPDQALGLAARCGATCMTGRGPYERQLALTAAGDESIAGTGG